MKIALRTFLNPFSFNFIDFVLLKRSSLFKGIRTLLDLLSYSTYPELDLSGAFLYT